MNALSDRINAMSESATLVMAQAARELASKGVDVINLSVGEPDFTTPKYIQEAAKKAIDDGFHFYTPVAGIPDLRQAIANKLNRENRIDCTMDNIVVSTGAKQAIANTVLSLVNPGDEVIILAPYWVSYIDVVKFAEGVPVVVSGTIENDFKATAQQIADAITPKTKAIIFSSPSNPAGALFTKKELEAIADVVSQKEDLYVLADEIYEYINYVGQHSSIGSIEKVKDRVITINGFSKGYAMTGWRIGYICAPLHVVKATIKIQGQFTSATNSITQKACVTAIEDIESQKETVKIMGEAFLKRRNLMYELLNNIPNVIVNVPSGAFYLFPDVSAYLGKVTEDGYTIISTSDLSLYLLNVANVSTVNGAAFGTPNNIRLSFATSEDKIVRAIERIKNSLEKLS
jgi:aspartate aminotransferase